MHSPDVSRWTQVVSHVSPHFGGIATSVPELARATEATGAQTCNLLGFCDPSEKEQVPPEHARDLETTSPSRARNWMDIGLRQKLRKSIQAADGVHIHGLWEAHSVTASQLATSCRLPYMISAHGMLDSWAIKQKRLKKALYAALVESKVLQRASCLRALTAAEVEDYRRLCLSNAIVTIPNGVDVPPDVTPELFWERFPELRGRRIVLFMGRLHSKKGLDLLMWAWHRLVYDLMPALRDEAHLVIAGPDGDGMLARLRDMATALDLGSSVTFPGMLQGSLRWSALAAAGLFVLPSYSEGFSVAVLEAMGVGCPVIISEPCHFPEVREHNCGWVIEPNVDALEDALRSYFEQRETASRATGARGRELVEERFSWAVVGQQMSEVYGWLEGGPKPISVEVIQ